MENPKDKIRENINWCKSLTPNLFSEDVIMSLFDLVQNIRDQNALKKYDTILSDDTSARLIALFMRRIISQKRREIGLRSPRTYFLASGRHFFDKTFISMGEFLSRQGPLGNILLVTEFIETGASILKIAEFLSKIECSFDIASVSTRLYRREYCNLIADLLFVGSENSGVGLKFHRCLENGVYKMPRNGRDIVILRDRHYIRESCEARKAMNTLADFFCCLL